jgi:hypothetical protein
MKANKILKTIPELLFTLFATTMVFSNSGINYVYLFCVLLFIVFIVTQNRIMGICISALTLLISLYMMLAVFFEFRKFPTINAEALTLLGIGMLLFLTTLLCSIFMLKKYINKTTTNNQLDTKEASNA